MSFFHEIKKQSLATRQIMFGLCVLTTVSMVGMIWYHSFENKLYTLMDNKPPSEGAAYLAENGNNKNSPTLFASAYQMMGNIKAAIGDLLQIFKKNQTANSVNTSDDGSNLGGSYKLPLSGDK